MRTSRNSSKTRKMNSTRCSRLAALLAVSLALVVAVAPAAAVSVSADGVPESAEVDSKVSASFTLTDLYTEYDEWTLRGETNLTQVTWTVTTYDQTGAKLAQESYSASSFNHSIAAGDDVNRVEVEVEGTMPEVGNWSYDPAQSLLVASFAQTQQGGTSSTLATHSTRPYTADSQSARTAIDDAGDAIEEASDAGADTSEAESLLESAVSAYDSGNFENAKNLAGQATEKAEASASSKQQTSMLLMGAGVVVLLVLVGAGVWYWRQSQDSYDKLG
jgi:cobalamin biosynthesis Mg chelatase CobN